MEAVENTKAERERERGEKKCNNMNEVRKVIAKSKGKSENKKVRDIQFFLKKRSVP